MPIVLEEYQQAILNGSLQDLFTVAGGSFVMALLLDGTELSGNGYQRKSISSIPEARGVGVNGLCTVRMVPDTPLTAVGGDLRWNQMRLLDSTGTNLVFPTFSTTGTILSGESKKVTAVFGLPDNDQLISRVTTLENELVATNAAVAATNVLIDELRAEFENRQLVDIRDFGGVANDYDFDNTEPLLEALAARDDDGFPYRVYFPAGEWSFQGSLGIADLETQDVDIASIVGVYSAPTFQHQEEANANDQKYYTRFRIVMSDESMIWWDHQRDYRFGPLSFADITFQIANKGSIFSFGNMENLSQEKVTARGILFERCYLTRNTHYGAANLGNGHPWLYDRGDGKYILNKTVYGFGIRGSQLYDSHFELIIRGFKHSYIMRQGDRITGDIRTGVCGVGIREYNAGAPVPSAVASQYSRIWSENHLMCGAVLTGQASAIRTEVNPGVYTVPPGLYDLPATYEWSIGIGGTYIQLDSDDSYDATDWFEPGMCYRFTPTTSGETRRWFYITEVTEDRLYFENSANYSYNPRTFAGDGSGILRPFGQGVVFTGSRCSPGSVDCGGGIEDLASVYVVPSIAPIKLPANSNGRTGDVDDAQDIIIVANCCGTTDSIRGGVDGLGSAVTSSHPLFNQGGNGPRYHRTIRECIFDPHTGSFYANAGRGTTSVQGEAKSLTFHEIPGPDGDNVFCLRPSDAVVYWTIRDKRLKTALATTVKLRFYVHTDNTTVYVSMKSAVSVSLGPFNIGWYTRTFSIASNQNEADISGAYVRVLAGGFFTLDAVITQTPT